MNPGTDQRYTALRASRVAPSRERLWLAADHLLHSKSTFFRERYTRYFWHDIQALVFYECQPSSTLEDLIEALVLISAVFALIAQYHLAGLPSAVVFLALYFWWRVRAVRYACLVATSQSAARLPLAASRRRAEQMFATLRAHVEASQDAVDATVEGEPSGAPAATIRSVSAASRLSIHTTLFAVELLSGCVGLLLAGQHAAIAFVIPSLLTWLILLPLLILSAMLQRDFEFPIPVKSVAIAFQLGTLLGGSTSFLFGLRFASAAAGGGLLWGWAMVAFQALCGLEVVYLTTLRRHPEPPAAAAAPSSLS